MAGKKKTDGESGRASTLDIALNSVIKKHGCTIKWLKDIPKDKHEFISSGSLGLDYALGGGFVRGRIVEVYGPPGSGKSTLALRVIAEANKLGMTALYVDAERALDPEMPIKYGVDPDKFMLEDNPISAEEHFGIVETMISSGDIGVCVVDSVTALITTAEMEADTKQEFMGKMPKFLSEKIRRLIQLLGETNTLFIFINQIRNKIGAYGNPETTPGGEAIKFYSTHRVRVEGGASKTSRIVNDKGEVIGHKLKYEVVKNKIASPYRSGELDLLYGKGFDYNGELVDLGVNLSVIEQGGAWYTYGATKMQGRDSVRKMVGEDEAFRSSLVTDINKILYVR